MFLGELGVGVLHIWKLNLNVPPPLSPPSLIQISSSGMAPLCHVKRCTLLENFPSRVCVSMSLCSYMWYFIGSGSGNRLMDAVC